MQDVFKAHYTPDKLLCTLLRLLTATWHLRGIPNNGTACWAVRRCQCQITALTGSCPVTCGRIIVVWPHTAVLCRLLSRDAATFEAPTLPVSLPSVDLDFAPEFYSTYNQTDTNTLAVILKYSTSRSQLIRLRLQDSHVATSKQGPADSINIIAKWSCS